MPSRLAWSVHAATDEVRRLIVPTTTYSMEELRYADSLSLARLPLLVFCWAGSTALEVRGVLSLNVDWLVNPI